VLLDKLYVMCFLNCAESVVFIVYWKFWWKLR